MTGQTGSDLVRATRAGAGYSFLDLARVLEAAGPDATSFLDSQLPLDLASLSPGEGGATALLDPRARLLADLTLARTGSDRWVLVAPTGVAPVLHERLEAFHIREKLTLGLRPDLAIGQIHGPSTPVILAAASGARAPTDPYRFVDLRIAEAGVGYLTDPWTGDLGGILLVGKSDVAAVEEALREAGRDHGLVKLDEEALEILRVEGGRPRFGVDVGERTLLPELDREEMVSRTTVCYVGQETVARIHSRGRVQRLFRGLVVEGTRVPPRGTLVQRKETPVGETGSAVFSPSLDRVVALGLIRREAAAPDTVVHLRMDGRMVAARVCRIPLYRPPGPREQADLLYRQGTKAFVAGDYERALRLQEKAVLMNPAHYPAHEAIGICQERLGRMDEAVATMESLSEMDPDNVMAWTNLSRYYAAQGRIEEAERIKGHVTFLVWKREAGEKEAERRAAEEEQKRQVDLEERVGLFRQVLELDPEDVVARFGLGKILLDLERFEEAVPHLRKAVERQADYSMAYNHLGSCLLALGRTAEAREALEKGVEAAERRGDWIPLQDMRRKLQEMAGSESR